MAGGIAHNIGQILIAALVVSSHYVLYYFPVLLIAGLLTGFLIGLLAQELIVRSAFLTENITSRTFVCIIVSAVL